MFEILDKFIRTLSFWAVAANLGEARNRLRTTSCYYFNFTGRFEFNNIFFFSIRMMLIFVGCEYFYFNLRMM